MDFCADYQPLLLDKPSLAVLRSPDYERFIHASVIEPGIRLLLARRRRRPDYPFVDTKFNPNTGADLPDEHYRRVYSWFLGRGIEALAGHLAVLDSLAGLTAAEKDEAREVFGRLIVNMADAILGMIQRNQGRCPFRVNLDMAAIDERGRPTQADPTFRSSGDLFCAKGLAAAGPKYLQAGLDLFMEIVQAIRANRYFADQVADPPGVVGQGPRMLSLGAATLLSKNSDDPLVKAQVLDVADEFIRFVLDHHWNAETRTFAEYVDLNTGRDNGQLDPGHANEFVGLGLQAIECMESDPVSMTDARTGLVRQAEFALPQILLASTRLGWNETHQGLHKLVDNRTGAVLNDDMPWWNLPETMRAAARVIAAITNSKYLRPNSVQSEIEGQLVKSCLEILRQAHNAYFSHYPNPARMLFPFQTRGGATGQVVDKVPAVPEGDPLYHANLSLLDLCGVLKRLGG